MPSDPSMTNDTIRRILQAILVLLIGWNLYVFGGKEHELFTTEHYFSGWEAYYGGYANEYFDYGDRYVTFNREGVFNLSNFESLQNNAPPKGRGGFMLGYDGAGRMFSSGFLPALIQRISFGTLNVHSAYFITNSLFWLIAIYVTYLFGRRAFRDPFTAFIAPALVACYPVFTLMFNSFKVQYAHCVFILGGLYLAHFVLRRLDLFTMTLGLACVFAMASFAGGGHVLLLAGLIAWLFACHTFARNTTAMDGADGRSSLRLLGAAVAGFAIAVAVTTLVRHIQDVPNESNYYDMRQVFLTDTISYFKAWLTGANRLELTFLGFKGDRFLTEILPMFTRSIYWSNPVVFCGGLLAFILCRDARPLVFTAVALFVPSHAPEILVSWVGAYGYGNAPSVLLLIIGFAGMIGALLSVRSDHLFLMRPAAVVAAVALFAASTGYYLTGRKHHADNYFFSWKNVDKIDNIHVYHGARYTSY